MTKEQILEKYLELEYNQVLLAMEEYVSPFKSKINDLEIKIEKLNEHAKLLNKLNLELEQDNENCMEELREKREKIDQLLK